MISLIWATNHAFVAGARHSVTKNAPGLSWRRQMYARMAATGQIGVSVRPTMTSTPLPSWSHFERRRWILTMDGEVLLSTATSPHERLVVGL